MSTDLFSQHAIPMNLAQVLGAGDMSTILNIGQGDLFTSVMSPLPTGGNDFLQQIIGKSPF